MQKQLKVDVGGTGGCGKTDPEPLSILNVGGMVRTEGLWPLWPGNSRTSLVLIDIA